MTGLMRDTAEGRPGMLMGTLNSRYAIWYH